MAAVLGKPLTSCPTSVEVPPISATIAFSTLLPVRSEEVDSARKAAPRIEFVGPEANVRTGYDRQVLALSK